jgi:hypothetical protein
MDDNQYSNAYKTASERILANLHDQFPKFKEFFYGDPFAIPVSQLPCIIVDPGKTHNELGPTGMDRVTQTIDIKVVLNKREDFAGDSAVSITKKKLVQYMEARDDTTKQYLPQTVMGVVRTFLTLSESEPQNLMVNSISDIDYGVSNRSSATYDTLAAEAVCTITTTELVRVDNRQ